MCNLKLCILYNGTEFYGWQKQKLKDLTVQQTIELAFKRLFNLSKNITVIGSGRTDSGVHAIGQVANIKLGDIKFNKDDFLYKINSILPSSIEISSFNIVDESFNARFDAKKREYRYYILQNRSKLPFFGAYSYYYPYKIDLKLLKRCLKYFKGIHDFSTFSNNNNKEEINPERKVYRFTCRKTKDFIIFRIMANSFLRGMVRNIIGTILDINKNSQNPAIIPEVFQMKNNKYCGNKAPSRALFLHKVYY